MLGKNAVDTSDWVVRKGLSKEMSVNQRSKRGGGNVM